MELKDKVIAEIKKIFDPEIPVNIYELGLIYDINIDKDNKVKILLTLYLSEITPPKKLKNIIGIAVAAATIPKLKADPVSLYINREIATIINL